MNTKKNQGHHYDKRWILYGQSPGRSQNGLCCRWNPYRRRDYLSKESHCPCLQPAGKPAMCHSPCRTADHRKGLPRPGPVATVGLYALRYLRTLPYVCRSHRQQPPGPGRLRLRWPQGRRRPFLVPAGRQSSPQSPGSRNRRRPGRWMCRTPERFFPQETG